MTLRQRSYLTEAQKISVNGASVVPTRKVTFTLPDEFRGTGKFWYQVVKIAGYHNSLDRGRPPSPQDFLDAVRADVKGQSFGVGIGMDPKRDPMGYFLAWADKQLGSPYNEHRKSAWTNLSSFIKANRKTVATLVNRARKRSKKPSRSERIMAKRQAMLKTSEYQRMSAAEKEAYRQDIQGNMRVYDNADMLPMDVWKERRGMYGFR